MTYFITKVSFIARKVIIIDIWSFDKNIEILLDN